MGYYTNNGGTHVGYYTNNGGHTWGIIQIGEGHTRGIIQIMEGHTRGIIQIIGIYLHLCHTSIHTKQCRPILCPMQLFPSRGMCFCRGNIKSFF